MRRFLLTAVIISLNLSVFGQTFNLHVGDPRNSWWLDEGTIDEAVLTVKPRGAFTEFGLYLTFSSRDSRWTTVEDSLEIILDFALPSTASITDSWLWVGEEIVQAEILDRWTASTIYENIVKRRKDPSILVKNSTMQYQLRIFPMAGNETRKVKINYLMPVTWSKETVSTELPIRILHTSSTFPEYLTVYAEVNEEWENPGLSAPGEIPISIEFTDHNNPDYLGFRKAEIPAGSYAKGLSINYDNPMSERLFFTRYTQGNEGVYQMVFFPSDIMESVSSVKVAILVDYDYLNSGLTSEALMSLIKNKMLENLGPGDSFNLFFSNLSIKTYSDNWVAATPENIESAFNSLGNPLSNYSNLAPLLSTGIEFVKEHGHDGKIILISDGDQYGKYQVANQLIYDLLELMSPRIPIHISNFQSLNYSWNYINGVTYYGNDYLYSNLSRLTGGNYSAVRNGLASEEAIGLSFKSTGGAINSFSLYTGLDEGYCHSRYLLSENRNIAYIKDPVIQIGKYKGSFPFKVEITGEYNNEIFSSEFSISEEDVIESDSLLHIIWASRYMHELERDEQTNSIINEIIYHSITNRILSGYTAFLCLEPDYNPNDPDDPDDDEFITRTEKDGVPDPVLLYPNPFSETIKIEFESSFAEDLKELAIFDLTGKLIYRFDLASIDPGQNPVIQWDGRNSEGQVVDPGVYLVVCRTSDDSRTFRIIKL